MRSIWAILLTAALAQAQQPRAFDVASIRELPKDTPLPGGMTFRIAHGSVTATSTLGALILHAYSLQPGQLIKAKLPAWGSSVLYDLKAKTETPGSNEETLSMLRALLSDRFGLKAHREVRELAYYALIAKDGAKRVKPIDPNAEDTKPVHEVFRLRNTKGVADFLASWMNVPVVDDTGLTGDFDMTIDARNISLNMGEERLRGSALVAALADALAQEVREQLGLKLERRKGPIKVLVVDSADRPGEK